MLRGPSAPFQLKRSGQCRSATEDRKRWRHYTPVGGANTGFAPTAHPATKRRHYHHAYRVGRNPVLPGDGLAFASPYRDGCDFRRLKATLLINPAAVEMKDGVGDAFHDFY